MCLFAILVKQDGKSGSSSGNHLDHGKQKKNDSKLFWDRVLKALPMILISKKEKYCSAWF